MTMAAAHDASSVSGTSAEAAQASGSTTAPAIDPSDTYLVVHATIANATTDSSAACGASIANTPHVVATPFPPRNPSVTG